MPIGRIVEALPRRGCALAMSPKYEVVAGPSYAEALAVAEVAIREWIETAKALGRPIPEARGRLAYS